MHYVPNNTINGWLIYVLAGIIVLLSITICVLIVYLIILKSNEEERAKTKLPETNGDKSSKFGADPESINKNKLQVLQDKDSDGFVVLRKDTGEIVGCAKTKEEANEIIINISKQDKKSVKSSNIDVQNRKGVDGEMVSYTNDKSTKL